MSTKNTIRGVEKLILSRLELNSRNINSKFRGRTKISQQLVSYTIKSLIKKEIIKNFYTVIDYSRLNLLNFRVYFRLSYINKERFDTLLKTLDNHKHTSWISSCGGRYDLICTFLAFNPSQFNKELRDIISKFPDQIQDFLILTTIVNRKFGRKYLFNDASALPQRMIGGDREPEKVDDIDLKIMDEIAEDARQNSVALGSKVSLTPKSVIHRIKKLQEKGIIKGFKPSIDTRKIGYVSNLLLIRYYNISVEMEDELINYLRAHSNVTNIVKTLGLWDIEVCVETKDINEFRKVEMEVRHKFASVINQTESIPLFVSYKENYFPKFLLEKQS